MEVARTQRKRHEALLHEESAHAAEGGGLDEQVDVMTGLREPLWIT
jgi:hypothetical protein